MITVGAVGPDDLPTGFSNESGALDLSAPGIGILTAVPGSFDPDATKDGFAQLDGHVVRRADGRRRDRLGARRAP